MEELDFPRPCPQGMSRKRGGNEEMGSIEVSEEVAPSGFVMPGVGGMGGSIHLDASAGLSRPMPTGHELGSEGREHGGDGGLPLGQDVPLPGSLGVRMRSVIV